MTGLGKLPRSGRPLAPAILALAACATSLPSDATDLRGRVQIESRKAVTIEIRSVKTPDAPPRKVVPDREGRYYVPDVPPGPYELVVNGKTFPIAVEQVAIQELPPILVKS